MRKLVVLVTALACLLGLLVVLPLFLLVALMGEAHHQCTGGVGGTVPAVYTGPGLAGLDATQTGHATAVVFQGRQMGVPDQGLVVALATVSQESGFKIYANDGRGNDLQPDQRGIARSLQLPHDAVGTDHGSLGLFQQQWPWWGSMEDLMDPAVSARLFYTALQRVPGWENLPVTVAAQRVQNSAYPDAYADDEPLARALLEAIDDTDSSGEAPETTPVDTDGDPYNLGPVQPQLKALVHHLAPKFGITTVGGYRESATDPNGHPAGLAADFMVPLTPEGRARGDALAAYVQQHAAEFGIAYVIWYQRIWSPARAAEGWRPMEDRGSATANHLDHPHVQVLPDSELIDPVNAVQPPALGLPAACAAYATAAGGGSPTVATFNVLGDSHTSVGGRLPGWDSGPARMQETVELLDRHQVSLVGLQEFQRPQEAEFRRLRGDLWGLSYPADRTANAVAWRRDTWRLVESRSVEVPYFHGRMTPMPVVLLENLAGSGRIWVVNVHNPADARGPAQHLRDRALGIEQDLVDDLHAETGDPVLLIGDLNDTEQAFCPLAAAGMKASAGGSHGPGGCQPPPRPGIDWIFGTSDLGFTGHLVDRSPQDQQVSDHPLVVSSVSGPGLGGVTGGAVLGGGIPSTTPPGPGEVTVLVYNIHRGANEGRALDRVAAELDSTGATIMLLNEIDRRPGQQPQAHLLGQQLGMYAAYGPNASFGPKQRGNAVLSVYPILRAVNTPLPHRAGTEPRGLLTVRLDVDGTPLDVSVTHLQPRSSIRLTQAQAVSQTIGSPACAGVLGGDMNSTPRMPEGRALDRHLDELFASGRFGSGATKPAARPRNQIDQLWHSPGSVRPITAQVMPRWTSDHRAILATYAVTESDDCAA